MIAAGQKTPPAEATADDVADATLAEDPSFAPLRFGALKQAVTVHWKVEERAHDAGRASKGDRDA